MATTWCPAPNSGAYNLVGLAHDKFMALGDRTYKMVIEDLGGLDNLPLSPVEFDLRFDFNGKLATFKRPDRPELRASDFVVRTPEDVPSVPLFNQTVLQPAAAPGIDVEAPTLATFVRPDRPNVAVPVMPGDPDPLVFPDRPGYTLPEVPTFEQLNLPDLPEITLPQFTGQLPELIEPPIDDRWSFEPEAYESRLKDLLFETISGMLRPGKAALPEAIEQAIFQRMRSRAEVETQREVQQLSAEFGRAGWNTPQPILSARIRDVRQRGQDRIAEANRDAAIKQYEETLANLRLALAQGASIEGVYVNLHVEEQRFALEAARFAREVTMKLLDFRLAVFQARMQGYQTEAQVLRDRIQAELAKVELFRAQIEGERARGEINEQRMRMYAEQVRTINLMADFYRTEMEAVKIKADSQRLVFDRYKTAMDGYDSRWKAYATEWQGYSASVDGENKRADLYRTMVDAQSKRVDTWATSEGLKMEHEKLRMQQHGQNLQVWQAFLSKRESDMNTERTRLDAVARLVESQARMYQADGSMEQAASAATDRSFQLGLEAAKARLQADTSTVELMIKQAEKLVDQLISINETKTRVGAQLAAASMSAVNYSAGISAGVSQSASCSQSYSFSGEIIDA